MLRTKRGYLPFSLVEVQLNYIIACIYEKILIIYVIFIK